MRISKSELGKIASNFIAVLDGEKVVGLKDLMAKLKVDVHIDERDFVRFDENFELESLLADYIRTDAGIPIELRFNLRTGGAQVIVKCSEQISGYAPFAIDPFGNIIQNKAVERFGGNELGRNELKYLSLLEANPLNN